MLQKVRDAKPDALFVFLPSGQGAPFMKQFAERGLDKAGIRLIATGDVTDDDQLNDMGDVALGVVNSHHYSAAHPSAVNKKFVADFQADATSSAPTSWPSAATTACALIYQGRSKPARAPAARRCSAAMKGQIFESPRGPVLIDAQTRDIVHDMYIRKVEKQRRPAVERRVRRHQGR